MPLRKGLSYNQRTMRALREQGRIFDKAEKWNQFGGPKINGKQIGARQDLFGFIDYIVLDPEKGFVAIQSTGPSGLSQHRKAILENPYAYDWLKTGWCKGLTEKPFFKSAIEIWSWRKLLVKRGGKLRRWVPRIETITIDMFTNV